MGQLASSGGARGSSLGLSVSPPRLHTRKRASQRIGTGSSSGMLYYDLALHRNVQLVDCRQWIPCSRDLAVHFK